MAAENTPVTGSEVDVLAGLEDFASFEKARNAGQLPEAEPVEPAKDPSAATSEETKAKSEPESDPDDKGEAEPKKKGGFQRRIDKLTQRNRELEAKLAEVSAGKPTETPAAEKAETAKPKVEDFQSYDDYVEALADYKLEQREKARQEKAAADARKVAEDKARSEHATRMEAWESRQDDAREKYADYDDVLEGVEIPNNPAFQYAVLTHENGAELAYSLASNPDELKRIGAITDPIALGRELGKYEAKLAAPTEKKPKTSKAPAPITPVGHGKSVPSLDDPDIPFDQWEKLRRSQLRG